MASCLGWGRFERDVGQERQILSASTGSKESVLWFALTAWWRGALPSKHLPGMSRMGPRQPESGVATHLRAPAGAEAVDII